jgi:hypothetical protein
MRTFRLLFPFVCILALALSCTPSSEQEDPAPDYSNQITGTYAYTTFKNGSATGSGTAIIAKESNTRITIALEDGISFYATNLQRIDDDMVMEVPSQEVDYYQMDARFSGTRTIDRGGAQYEGVYFGQSGELKIGLQISVGNTNEPILLVLDR